MEKLFDCCPPLDIDKWNDKIHEWKDKLFIKDYVKAFFNIPCNIGRVKTRLNNNISELDLSAEDYLCLFDHKTKFKIDIYVAVKNEISGFENITISGKYYTKVYEGAYSNITRWRKDFKDLMRKKKLKQGKQYIWYTSCHKCAKKYEKNYIVFIGEILE